MPSFQSIPQTRSYYFLHSVFSKMIITTTSTTMIPNAIYTKNAGKIFSSKPIINARIAIIDIPIPIVLHSFFSLYFAFSSFEAVLYQEINQLPCPEIKTMESTANNINPTYTTQSGPVDKSASFICITPPPNTDLFLTFYHILPQNSILRLPKSSLPTALSAHIYTLSFNTISSAHAFILFINPTHFIRSCIFSCSVTPCFSIICFTKVSTCSLVS